MSAPSTGAGLARADSPDISGAEALFRDGKALLTRHDYVRACPLLAASFALEPGTGVLLALAICHEGEGKLASALAEYRQVVERAGTEGRSDRADVARQRAAALEPRLSTLAVVPPALASQAAGFVLARDGQPIEASAWSVPVPVDGGEHAVDASAPGKRPWHTTITMAPSNDRRVLAVPELENAPPLSLPAPPPPPAQAEPAPLLQRPGSMEIQRPLGPRRETNALRVTGLALVGAGAVSLGVGSLYGIRAIDKYGDSKGGCMGDVCNPDGKRDRLAALSAGDTATVAFIAGSVVVAAGVALYLLGVRAHRAP